MYARKTNTWTLTAQKQPAAPQAMYQEPKRAILQVPA